MHFVHEDNGKGGEGRRLTFCNRVCYTKINANKFVYHELKLGATKRTSLCGGSFCFTMDVVDPGPWCRTHLGIFPSRVASDLSATARREEEVVTSALHRREVSLCEIWRSQTTPRGEEIARTLRDTANSSDSFVAPPRSIQRIHLRSSLLGLAGIGSYRGGRSFEMGSKHYNALGALCHALSFVILRRQAEESPSGSVSGDPSAA